jgi:hypothetical protein
MGACGLFFRVVGTIIVVVLRTAVGKSVEIPVFPGICQATLVTVTVQGKFKVLVDRSRILDIQIVVMSSMPPCIRVIESPVEAAVGLLPPQFAFFIPFTLALLSFMQNQV